jgi:hypothetical protein
VKPPASACTSLVAALLALFLGGTAAPAGDSGLDHGDPLADHVRATYAESAHVLETQLARLRARAATEP